MKKLLIIFALVMFFTGFGQINKLRTTGVAYKYKTTKGWSDWSNWKDISILILVNLNDLRITVYSKEVQTFDIITVSDTYKKDGVDTLDMYCVDSDGKKLIVSLTNDKEIHLYIRYNDWQHVYSAYNLDN
jgi:hypothetical protein